MFKPEMKAKIERIFDLKKVSFDLPSESQEQEAAFIQITKAAIKASVPIATGRVEGKIKVFANSDKLPYGYFEKCIQRAKPADTHGFLFLEIDNAGTFLNIAERSISFVYLFEMQYDPEQGLLNELNTAFVES